MILEEAKIHLDTLVRLLQGQEELNREYVERLVKFTKDFDTWTPEVYILIDKGLLYGIWANCSMHPNEFHTVDDFAEGDPEADVYGDEYTKWKELIQEGVNKGFIKRIF